MPTKYFILPETHKSELVYDPLKIVFNPYIQLLPTDDNGEFSRGIDSRFRSSGIVEFPNVKIAGLIELFSFEQYSHYSLDEDDNLLGTIEFQLSNDDGTTWLYWTGSAWATAGAGDWNSDTEIQDNIAAFPFVTAGEKQIKVRAQLSPDSYNEYTPELRGVAIHYELDFIPEEDVIRSLVGKLDDELRVITETGMILATSRDNFTTPLEVEIDEVIGVWNITDDPGRLTNLYSSINKTLARETETGEKYYTQVITMTSAQSANSEIIARVKVKIPVFISPDGDYVISELPQAIIEIEDHSEDFSARDDGMKVEKNHAKLKARIRRKPEYYRMPLSILSTSPDELLSKQINRAIVRLLKKKYLVSLATGEKLPILDEAEFASANDVREDLTVKIFKFAVRYKDWPGDYTEEDLVETFTTSIDYGGVR